ncbi:hypothetical protein SNEBB_001554 [Seison nebaliae]|nr:hypothetical protein SNEBB_001554 [Seison nebaliae]
MAPPVNIGLYMESLCPDCVDFTLGQLEKAEKEVGTIMKITFYPFGNTKITRQSPYNYEYVCQHGPVECRGNILETCALNYITDEPSKFTFIHCMEYFISKESEKPSNIDNIALKCAKSIKFDERILMSCANSTAGNVLEYYVGTETAKLRPKHEFVPWVTVNGIHTDKIQHDATENLTKLVCDTYLGPDKPQICFNQKYGK